MKFRLSLLALAMLFSVCAEAATKVAPAPAASTPTPVAAAPQARLVAASSEVTFTAKQVGVPMDGRFKRFDAQISLDPKQPQNGKVNFGIELGSVSIAADTDAELLKPEWFNTARFPKATFVSSSIKATGAGRFDVSGKLSIKGQQRDLTVPVVLAAAGGNTVATGSFALKRLDFKVGEGDWADTSVVANDVLVKFKLTLQGLPAF
jgi:polyisoprenoid-binding protein YceI